MKTWLKGGLVGAGIGFIFVFTMPLIKTLFSSGRWLWDCTFHVDRLCNLWEFMIWPVTWVSIIILVLIGWGIGSFIGWLIRKIKGV